MKEFEPGHLTFRIVLRTERHRAAHFISGLQRVQNLAGRIVAFDRRREDGVDHRRRERRARKLVIVPQAPKHRSERRDAPHLAGGAFEHVHHQRTAVSVARRLLHLLTQAVDVLDREFIASGGAVAIEDDAVNLAKASQAMDSDLPERVFGGRSRTFVRSRTPGRSINGNSAKASPNVNHDRTMAACIWPRLRRPPASQAHGLPDPVEQPFGAPCPGARLVLIHPAHSKLGFRFGRKPSPTMRPIICSVSPAIHP